jgi:hypothetical protein
VTSVGNTIKCFKRWQAAQRRQKKVKVKFTYLSHLVLLTALGTVHTHGMGLLRRLWWPVGPKLLMPSWQHRARKLLMALCNTGLKICTCTFCQKENKIKMTTFIYIITVLYCIYSCVFGIYICYQIQDISKCIKIIRNVMYMYYTYYSLWWWRFTAIRFYQWVNLHHLCCIQPKKWRSNGYKHYLEPRIYVINVPSSWKC